MMKPVASAIVSGVLGSCLFSPGLAAAEGGRPDVPAWPVVAPVVIPSPDQVVSVGAITVVGTSHRQPVIAAMSLRPGSPYSAGSLAADLRAIAAVLPMLAVKAELLHPAPGTVSIVLTVEETPDEPVVAAPAPPGAAVLLTAMDRPVTLHVGDPAPALQPASWLGEGPVDGPAAGGLTIVEFCCTWHFLKEEALPRLNAITTRFAGRRVGAVCIKIPGGGAPESVPALPAKVLSWCGPQVGLDGPSGTGGLMADRWLRAAGRWLPREERYRTPTAFIVGDDGRIRWMGDPRRGMPEIIERMLANTWLGLTVVAVDSEQFSDLEQAENATDGDPLTIWHTQWRGGHPGPPHEIVLALSQEAELAGMWYLPRQNSLTHGSIAGYEVLLSDDGVDFGHPVARGRFTDPHALAVVDFPPRRARFLKLRALSECRGMPWASAAEIGVLRPGDPRPVVPGILPLEDSEPLPAGGDDF